MICWFVGINELTKDEKYSLMINWRIAEVVLSVMVVSIFLSISKSRNWLDIIPASSNPQARMCPYRRQLT